MFVCLLHHLPFVNTYNVPQNMLGTVLALQNHGLTYMSAKPIRVCHDY